MVRRWVAGARIWWVRTRKLAVSVLEAVGMPTDANTCSRLCVPSDPRQHSKCDSLHSHPTHAEPNRFHTSFEGLGVGLGLGLKSL
jgi:hypothetical protein